MRISDWSSDVCSSDLAQWRKGRLLSTRRSDEIGHGMRESQPGRRVHDRHPHELARDQRSSAPDPDWMDAAAAGKIVEDSGQNDEVAPRIEGEGRAQIGSDHV